MAKRKLRAMTEADARVIAEWHYGGEDAIYDLSSDREEYRDFFAKERWRHGFYVGEDSGQVIGFIRFATFEEGVIELGVGLRPDLVGKGLGLGFLRDGLEFARQEFHPLKFVLHVQAVNQRAAKVYHRAGFVSTRRFIRKVGGTDRECIEMELGP